MNDSPVEMLGWREWVSLPEHGVAWMKAKVDTGARTSAIHAFALDTFDRNDTEWARFEVHPWQRSDADAVTVEAPVIDRRVVRSSSGDPDLRIVVVMPISVAGRRTLVEMTLARRDEMGFRMLLGRQALRGRFVVDPGRSYLGGRPPKATRAANRARPTDAGDRDA